MDDAGVRKQLAGIEAHVTWDELAKLEICVNASPGRVLPGVGHD